MSKFVFQFDIATNGNFGFKYIPTGMKYDGDENFTLHEEFDNKEHAVKRATEVAVFMQDHVVANNDATKGCFVNMLDSFIKSVNENKNDVIHCKNMGGEYDGTEVLLKEELNRVRFDIGFTDEEYRLFKESSLSYGTVKKMILDGCKKMKDEM